MSFRKNEVNTLDFNELLVEPTSEEVELIGQTWAKDFYETVFLKINEQPYAALFSKKDNSRPNVPVNVIIGLLTLKEIFGLTDEEAIGSLLFDARFKYALRATEMKSQITNVSVLTRFRKRVAAYEAENGTDLVKDTFLELEKNLEGLMGIMGTRKRMDSMMIAANIKKLGRLELMYEAVSDAVREIEKRGGKIPEELAHYTEKSDRNKEFYHNETGYACHADKLIKECERAREAIGELQGAKESPAAKNLGRVIEEQTTGENGKRRMKTAGEGMGSGILQNPADPEATFREKAGKEHRGYVANIEESVGEDGSLVSDYDVPQNTYSDKEFLKGSLEKASRGEEKTTIVADGAYASEENRSLADQKNIELVTTNLTGKETPDVFADFGLDDDDRSVTECPCGNKPGECSYNEKSGTVTACFDREKCAACPLRDKCGAKIGKKHAKVKVSRAKKERALSQRFMKTCEFKELYKFRNGVEPLPSQFRRGFHVDRMPQHGLGQLRIAFGLKAIGLNFKKYRSFKARKAEKQAAA